MKYNTLPLKERIDKYIIKTDTCWFWKNKQSGQYIKVWDGSKPDYLHRIVYRLFVGVIPDGLLVCHSCDNPSCGNPDHLWVGTQKDNMQDCKLKKRRSYDKTN